MVDLLVNAFVTAFMLVTLVGHVLVAQALLTPDPTA